MYLLYAHEQAGGIGVGMMEDLVNVNRLMLMIACLDQGVEIEVIMRGAVDRLHKYAGLNGCPMVENITNSLQTQTRHLVVHVHIESMDGKEKCNTRC
jgi:hypothetical protein